MRLHASEPDHGRNDLLNHHLLFGFFQQIIEIKRFSKHFQTAIKFFGPKVFRFVPVKLNSVFIGIFKIKSFRNSVVRGAGQGIICLLNSLENCCQVFSCGIENGGMKKPGSMDWRRRSILAVPGI